jgi:hypothetical protein
MRRLRHPIRAIREPFGTAGLVIACIALVAALGGTAIAAKNALTAKQKKEVEKIAKKYAGKPGAPGAPGAAGLNGKDGAAGANGAAGAAGVSPTGIAFAGAKAGHCTEGGVEFKGANTTYACNGVKGQNGQTGFTDVLPKGKTETGSWALWSGPGMYNPATETFIGEEIHAISLPFNIPLSAAPEELIYMKPDTVDPNCPGNIDEPKAAEGKVCIYVEGNYFQSPGEELGTRRFLSADKLFASGAAVGFKSFDKNKYTYGTWAVTAK